MNNSYASVKNPLAVIAIFAGLANTSGVAILPLVDKSIQMQLVYFVTGFPTLLLIAFFFHFIYKT